MPFADAHKFWAGDATETAYVPDLVQPGPIEGMLTAQLRRRRRGDAPRLRLSRIVRIPVRAGVPHLARAAGRAHRRRPDRRADRLDRARDHRAGRRGDTGLAAHARPADGNAVRRGPAPPHRPPAVRQPGWFAAINDPIVGRALAARPRRPRQALDRRDVWRARRARRAPFSPSDSTRCSAGRRSTTSPAGASRSPPSACAAPIRASARSPPRSATSPRPPSIAHSSASPARRRDAGARASVRPARGQNAGGRRRAGRRDSATPPSDSSVALPPAAAVLTVTICSVAKRRR